MDRFNCSVQKFFIYSLFLLIFPLLITTCVTKRPSFTILFEEDVEDLKENSKVFLGDTEVGRVMDIEHKKGKVAVSVIIKERYKNNIKEKSEFYILDSEAETYIQIYVVDEDSPPLVHGSTVEGSPEFIYWIRKGVENIEEWIKKGSQETEKFLDSDDWKEFKSKTRREIDKLGKGIEELIKRLEKEIEED